MAGEIMNDAPVPVISHSYSKQNVAITKGNVVVFDTDGWIAADATAVGKIGVALETITATTSVRKLLPVLLLGVVRVVKAAGTAWYVGQYAAPAASAEVTVWVNGDAQAAYAEAEVQAIIDKFSLLLGTIWSEQESADVLGDVLVGVR